MNGPLNHLGATLSVLAVPMAEVRTTTLDVGVNLFVPNPLPVGPDDFGRYAAAIQAEADRYGIDLDGTGSIAPRPVPVSRRPPPVG